MAGISEPGFDCTGVLYPKTEICRECLWCAPAAIVTRLIKCRQVGAKASIRGGFRPLHGSSCRHCVQTLAYLRLRLCLGLRDSAGREPRQQTSSGPSTETRSSIFACCVPQYWAHWPRKDAMCVADPSTSCLGWFGMRSVLASKLRHPKAVVGIGRKQL